MEGISSYVQEQIRAAGSNNFASPQAERGIISRMLTNSDEAEAHVRDLQQSDFYYDANGKIFRAIQAVVAKRMKVDMITVDAAFGELFPKERSELAAEMIEALQLQLQAFANIEDYIRIVRELSARRNSIRSFEALAAQMRDPTREMGDVLQQMRLGVGQETYSGHQWQNLQDVLMSTYDYLDKRANGQIASITTGISTLDALIGGFFPGELTVIGARPSVGKSAFGANIALAAAQAGFKVCVVSREMTDIQYGVRILSNRSWVDGMNLRKGTISDEDWIALAGGMTDVGALPIEFMFSVRTVEDLVQVVQAKANRKEIDILIVDYLQLLQTQRRFDKDYLRVGFVSSELKHLAIDTNIPIIALAQVGRDTEGSMPTLKSLRDSGNIEQDADGVMFLHRPSSVADPYVDPRDKDSFPGWAEMGKTYLVIGVAKQRQGSIGKACVLFDAGHMRYIAIERNREG